MSYESILLELGDTSLGEALLPGRENLVWIRRSCIRVDVATHSFNPRRMSPQKLMHRLPWLPQHQTARKVEREE